MTTPASVKEFAMLNNFGPWATMLDMDQRASLGTFWKRRIAMLRFAQSAGPRPSRRAAAVLALFGALTLAAPMLSLSLLPAAPPDGKPSVATAPVAPPAASGGVVTPPSITASWGPEVKIEKLPDGMPLDAVPVPGKPNVVVRPIGLAEVTAAPLVVSGWLTIDPNRLASVRPQFSGDVIAIGTTRDRFAAGEEAPEREIRQGDRVTKGQLLAVIWSKELGELKNNLADAIAAKCASEEELRRVEALPNNFQKDSEAHKKRVELDEAAVQKLVRTLRLWRVPEEEIDSVRRDVERRREPDAKSPGIDLDWARVEVRAPLAGVVLEKNAAVGDFVDQKAPLFKVADLAKLAVTCSVPAEYISELQALPPERRGWSIHQAGPPVMGHFDAVGEIVEPNGQAFLTGTVDNESGALRPGQLITARILDSQMEFIIPAAAVIGRVDNDVAGLVWVETDSGKPSFESRYLRVAGRGGGTVVYTRHPGIDYVDPPTGPYPRQPSAEPDLLRVGARVVVWGPEETINQTNASRPAGSPTWSAENPPSGNQNAKLEPSNRQTSQAAGSPGRPAENAPTGIPPGTAAPVNSPNPLGPGAPADRKPARTIKGFGTLVDPDGDCLVKEASGKLTIKIPKTWHDLTHTAYYSQLNAPRILQDVKGDFSLEDKVATFESPSGKALTGGIVAFVSSGLLVWQDERNFIRLERRAYNKRLYVWLERFQDGKPVVQLGNDIEDHDTWLRVTRSGDRFQFFTSPDGKQWHELLAEVIKLNPEVKVGVSAINSTATEFSVNVENLKLVERPQ
ncbi:MAG TPA: efflux RND transporter periplasmic adaptor subunit [Pirellulales bacterium]|nr:efflux RND transporter periplasmic adaptor subunit [Pirellulales bacterium]